MFHEITYREQAKRRRRVLIVAACVAVVAVAAAVAIGLARRSARVQGAAALRESILNAAKQCAAIEGSYPSDLAHLEDSYGLTINHDDYVITYECFADNIAPSVVVSPK
ncbi:hypothetical protein [Paratractidigestivibacter sp.]|uniref:hypothetical protein n=1 Tax=Paratractidigestivibacter sp. TaxID=2847316 RepID=UPI002ABD9366|nr:hypothetical protein [Paratractidigestivibacter sp.]